MAPHFIRISIPKSMIKFTILPALAALLASGVSAQDFLHFEAKPGPGKGKKVVLLAGDEEYRSEEAMPMLGKILSQKHGFHCDVLFSADADGTVQPGKGESLTHPESLDSADAIVMSLRFRHWPDAAMKKFEDAVNRGVPIVGLRTSTHAFNIGKNGAYAKWSYNSREWQGGFGRQVLGETWINHHGAHKKEGTRGIVEPAGKGHPVLRGVGELFGDTDVYTASPLPDVTILVRGEVTQSLDPKSPAVAGAKNNPMQPIVWVRENKGPQGKTNRIVTTTMGSASDFRDEDLRRLAVNGVYWGLGLEVPASADVDLVDPWEPSAYGFNGHRQGLKVADLGLGKALAQAPAQPKPEVKKAKSADVPPHAFNAEPPPASGARPQKADRPDKGERIVFIGNGLAERDVYFSRLEPELHLRFPEAQLVVRNMGRPGDTPGFRPHPARASQWAFPGAEKFHPDLQQHNGKGFFPTPDQWLTHLKADTIVAFFGYNESFDGPDRAGNFEAELEAFVKHTLSKAYNGAAAPRLVLVSPVAFEDLSSKRDLPDGKKENANLALYTAAMAKVAGKYGLTFVDFFTATQAGYTAGRKQPLTINGFAPTEAGYTELGGILADGLYGKKPLASKAEAALVHAAVKEKDYCWNNDYNIVNGVHTHGQRYNPYGPQNYPDEIAKTREMMALRESRIHAIAQGKTADLKFDDSATRALPSVPTNFNRPVTYVDGSKAVESFTMANGYKAELFASEREFPDLKNPVQMSFDNKGRLWVAVMPTYPHWKPGDAKPDDKLLIFEDTNNDGRADTQKVFASGLHLPIGFELAPEGVYISLEPNLCLLVDDNHDDKADRLEILMHGFDTHDTHHAISAYCADASGAFYLLEGRFLHSQVETPYGPRRCNDGGAWRFDPKSFRLERYNQVDVNNPWGFSFDYWEQGYLSDASSGQNWWGLPISAKMPYGVEITKVGEFAPKRSRPTSGAEFVSSRHFPDEAQGDFMICNSIGFLGISFHDVFDDGSGFSGKHTGDLLSSTDPNFRPVDIEFAPDGSLYCIDWHNALIGHMQHNARDPNRDHDHGRIYRITYPSRPLVKPVKVAGASIAELLENLKEPEYRTRYRTRREFRSRPASEVIPAVKAWVAKLDKTDPQYEHNLCEALWTTWAQNKPDLELLRLCLHANAHQARAAAVNVLRYSAHQIPSAVDLFMQAARDAHGRVRLEAIVAASWLDNADGARIVLEALKLPLDKWMGPVTEMILQHTLKDDVAALQKAGTLALEDNPNARDFLAGKFKFAAAPKTEENKTFGPTRKLTDAETKLYNLGREVFLRDAHCATCHQPNGQGLPNIYPTLGGSEWLDDDERFIKIVLKGLWGPITVKGQTFDPSKGVPPMMPFAGLLNDEEVAAVIGYVRQSFGNNGAFVDPAKVKQIREATKDRLNFYMVDEILKEHPLKK